MTPILGEIVHKTYGYEATVIIPFLLSLNLENIKTVSDAQTVLDRLIHDIWLDDDISPIVESLNELGRDVGISRTVSPKGKLLIREEDLEKLKMLGRKIAEEVCELFEPPYDRSVFQYLALVVGRPKKGDIIINLDKQV